MPVQLNESTPPLAAEGVPQTPLVSVTNPPLPSSLTEAVQSPGIVQLTLLRLSPWESGTSVGVPQTPFVSVTYIAPASAPTAVQSPVPVQLTS